MTVYSKELRRRIVEAYEAAEDSMRGLAERFCVSPTTVQAYVRRWRETHSLEPSPRRYGPRPLIPDAHLDRVRRLVDAQNDATLEEYAVRYTARYGVPIRKSAFARALHRARLTRKKKTLSASEADSEPIERARERFLRRARMRRHRRFIFVDEFGLNRATGRRYGRAPANVRARGTQPANPDPNLTLVVGLTSDGPVAPMMLVGAMDGNAFTRYVEQCLAPELSAGDVVVWDGLGAHRVATAHQIIERRGAEVLPLPGYSPDFNPDEELGSKLKTLARGRPHDTAEQIIDAVGWAYTQVSSSDAQGWFSHRAAYLYPS
jgi:transposase